MSCLIGGTVIVLIAYGLILLSAETLFESILLWITLAAS